MTEVETIFEELGIQQYLHDFLEQGFDSWETILDITESDFDALGVKLGHRRKLQRKIANSRGVASDTALHSSRNTPSDDRTNEDLKGGKTDVKEVAPGTQGAKRKYRRHPKADEHAPGRPPSAYVLFSNSMRNDLKDQSLSFTEIAKLVGENWQNLPLSEKEPFEQEAFVAKEKYNNELAEYKKTSYYKDYMHYLHEFKARQANQQPVTDLDPKRPKLEAHASATSTGTLSSGASQHGGDTPVGRLRVESSGSNSAPWTLPDGQPSPQLPIHSANRQQGSPPLSSATILPGYRDSFFTDNRQALAGFRDDPRDEQQQLPGISTVGSVESLNLASPVKRSRRNGPAGPPPPLLIHESTNRSTGSSSYSYFTPRTPIDSALEHPSMPYFSKRYPGNYENQLPPIQPASLSPQATEVNLHQSPNGVNPILEFPTSMAPMRGFGPATSHHASVTGTHDSRLLEYGSSETTNVDPVTLLILASEIQKQNSPRRAT